MSLLLAIGFFVLTAWAMSAWYQTLEKQLDEQRAAAQAQFRHWLQTPAAAQLHLGAEPITPVHILEDKPRRNDEWVSHYCLTWFLRSAEGRYVMLMSTQNEKPFVKVLEDRYARAVLKARYRTPD